jgi:hypothetical protein
MRRRIDAMRWLFLGMGLAACGAAAAAGADIPPSPAAAGSGTVIAYLADGTSVPLQGWTLSYEYVAWKKGTPFTLAQPSRRGAAELWVGKRALPVIGSTVEIQYQDQERVRDDRGVALKERISVARGLTVQPPSGEKISLKLEPPAKELLLPGADKDLLVTARGLDLRGQTLTGTAREYCLLSFSAMVECGTEAESRVVKLEFTSGQ